MAYGKDGGKVEYITKSNNYIRFVAAFTIIVSIYAYTLILSKITPHKKSKLPTKVKELRFNVVLTSINRRESITREVRVLCGAGRVRPSECTR